MFNSSPYSPENTLAHGKKILLIAFISHSHARKFRLLIEINFSKKYINHLVGKFKILL